LAEAGTSVDEAGAALDEAGTVLDAMGLPLKDVATEGGVDGTSRNKAASTRLHRTSRPPW
jgi:hypothetical protein